MESADIAPISLDAVTSGTVDLSALFSDWSIEVTPAGAASVGVPGGVLPANTRVFITHLERNRDAETIAAARFLRKAGFQPIPHLAARRISTSAELDALLDGLVGEAAVDEVLIIAGDTPAVADRFPSTIDLLRTGLLEKHGIRRIGVSGHPEGAPKISDADLSQALDDKNSYARDSEADFHIVTQFCFDAAPIIAWEKRIRERGNQLPIRVGLAGLASFTSLLRHAKTCGVGASMRVLLTQAARFSRLMRAYDPGPIAVEIARAKHADANAAFAGVHLFPFGGFDKTVRWAAAIEAGRCTLGADGSLAVREAT